MKTLRDAAVGDRLTVWHIGCESGIAERLLELGLTEGTEVECVGKSPLGDPLAFLIRDTVIALRGDDCANIAVEPEGTAAGAEEARHRRGR